MELKNKKRVLPAINIQAPWSQLILCGKKTIETRFYPLPAKYIEKDMLLIETPGVNAQFKARIVGIVRFSTPFIYRNKNEFYDDKTRHQVSRESDHFTWESGGGKRKWGWPITYAKPIQREIPRGLRRGIVYTKAVSIESFVST